MGEGSPSNNFWWRLPLISLLEIVILFHGGNKHQIGHPGRTKLFVISLKNFDCQKMSLKSGWSIVYFVLPTHRMFKIQKAICRATVDRANMVNWQMSKKKGKWVSTGAHYNHGQGQKKHTCNFQSTDWPLVSVLIIRIWYHNPDLIS